MNLSKLTDIFRKLNRVRLGKRFRDNVVGIATRYGLDGSGIKSLWGGGFCTRPDWLWGSPSLLSIGYRVVPERKAAGAWR